MLAGIAAGTFSWGALAIAFGCGGAGPFLQRDYTAFARQGLRFTDAYAAAPICSPTRAAIMTGKYPARLHLTDWIPGRTNSSTGMCLIG